MELQNTSVLEFKLPLPFPPLLAEPSLAEYLTTFTAELPNYLLILLQAGQGAIAYFEAGEMENHKVIRRYMVRAQQGKAQIKHLKSKGKSKLGSRVRLAQTLDFFEEINEKLQDWEVADQVSRILYSSSIDLWNLMFDSKIEPPFEKRDPRLRKIPTHIYSPNYEELLRINDFALQGYGQLMQTVELDFFKNLF
ncbi:MAG: hypothetical protein MUE85_11560 [Microscillaceae bacterium]|nr:hypothetical protein [Microscillaceae bacterium]